MFPGPPKPERGEGTKNGRTVPKTGTRAHSPKPPFYKTALLFPLKSRELTRNFHIISRFGQKNWGFLLNPDPHIQGKNMNKHMAPKLLNLPCFEAFGVIFCPDVCSYVCLVCGGGCHWRISEKLFGAISF